MGSGKVDRRDFLKYVIGGASLMALDWSSLPRATGAFLKEDEYDAIIIGSGLGGLSCGAAFARQGYKVLVVEQHDRPGGYATTFQRPGGFTFDVSLHSTSVGERNGVYNLISGFPEITDVEFVQHPNLYRVIFPEHDIRVPQKDIEAYIKMLQNYYPQEKDGIRELFKDMEGLTNDIVKLSNAHGQIDMSRFPTDFPYLFAFYNKTWKNMVDARLKDEKLKAIVSAQWGYYGLPPSKLVSFYYALPAIGYLTQGGYYPIGRSQKISDALARYIDAHGGKVMLSTRIENIVLKDHAACGVTAQTGEKFMSKVVVSNASPYETFRKMMNEEVYLKEYLEKLDKYSVSLSSFQIFLGLKDDVVGRSGVKDSEIFFNPSYDIEGDYLSAVNCNMDNPGFAVSLYDNIYKGYSPEGKNTLNILTIEGYEHWKPYESDYFNGNKTEYRKEKERIADILIEKAEKTLLPGLSAAIEVKEIGTPLTNVRYTRNYRGAIYGWDQTVDNSGNNRLPHDTPIKNLFLAGAWTRPGHGYGSVISSGLECFSQIVKGW